MEICKQKSEVEMRHLPAISNWQIFFGQSIGIDETNTFQLKHFSSKKILGATGFDGLWA